MNLYLTSAKVNEDKMPWLRGWLEHQGHRVTSTWFDPAVAPLRGYEAPIAMVEIACSTAVVVFTAKDEQVSPNAAFECGYAYALGKKVYYIGPPPDMFTSRYGERWPTVPLEVTCRQHGG